MIVCVGTGREIEIDWVEVGCRQEVQKECIHLESLNRLTAPNLEPRRCRVRIRSRPRSISIRTRPAVPSTIPELGRGRCFDPECGARGVGGGLE